MLDKCKTLERTHQEKVRCIPQKTQSSGKEVLPLRGTVLVIDDEAMLRRLLHAALHHQGYQVMMAGNGAAR